MSKRKNLMILVTLLVFLAAVPTFAAKGSARFTISSPLFVAGNEVNPGQYEIKWEANSAEATVTFMLMEKVVVKVQGKIVEGDKKFNFDTFLTGKDSAGRAAIKEIQFGGKKIKIVFE